MGVYENMIQNKMNRLKWKANFTSAVAVKFDIHGASEGTLSKALNGGKELNTVDTAQPLDDILGRVIKMCDRFSPFKIRFDDADEAKRLLNEFEDGRLAIKVEQFGESTVIHPFWIIIMDGRLFARATGGSFETVPENDYANCAAFKSNTTANAVEKLLRSMGASFTRTTTVTNVRRPAGTIHDKIADFGFVQEPVEAE